MKQQYVVTRMKKDEIRIAIEWAKEEGWNPGLHDEKCFYQTDPNGFFAGYLNGKIIAVGSAVIYDDHFAFCGFYIVDHAYRNKGYGLELTKARLEYIGNRNAGLDGVIPMIHQYERLGYKLAYHNARFVGKEIIQLNNRSSSIVPINQVNMKELSEYDSKHFPAFRESFLKCWVNQEGALSLGYLENGQIKGYGVIRPCFQGYKIGPLFADNETIADNLFQHLAHFANDKTYYLDIPTCNQHAVNLINRYQMKQVFETARMYLKENPTVAIDNIYGITSFELG